ncbi:MAG: hypothetical protein AVDCRST_MAG51-2945 [uncultured Ramlibacter sp.]|uniref:SCP domain-containing protein n=1 Tax=uncultured Ramlibacter sp. TaxID=260755 RepID=A0A6J4Q6Z2_9BURK|nr:MAG: hypothetical protein AVDCRST_MAG51-2945 [uncultured Ramlibacter sp.]
MSGPPAAAPAIPVTVYSASPSATQPVTAGARRESCDPTALQRSVLQQVNAARAAGQTCGNAQLPPASPVTWHQALASAAAKHSRDMAKRDFFGHRSPDGAVVEQRVRREGYPARAAGESIAGGDYTPEGVVRSWFGNEKHCRNLMSAAFTEVGASCVTQPGSDWGTYWTMVLGSRGADSKRAAPASAPPRTRSAVTPKARATAPAKARTPSTAPKPSASR